MYQITDKKDNWDVNGTQRARLTELYGLCENVKFVDAEIVNMFLFSTLLKHIINKEKHSDC